MERRNISFLPGNQLAGFLETFRHLVWLAGLFCSEFKVKSSIAMIDEWVLRNFHSGISQLFWWIVHRSIRTKLIAAAASEKLYSPLATATTTERPNRRERVQERSTPIFIYNFSLPNTPFRRQPFFDRGLVNVF